MPTFLGRSPEGHQILQENELELHVSHRVIHMIFSLFKHDFIFMRTSMENLQKKEKEKGETLTIFL